MVSMDILKIEDSGTNYATFNISGRVEEMVFKQSFPLNKENMRKENKSEYIINKNDGLMVLFYDLERIKDTDNYTMHAFGNFNYTQKATKPMNIHYCNQSYLDVTCSGDFTGGCTETPHENIDYCVYLNSLPSAIIDTRTFTDKNSSYIGPDTYGIIEGKIGGIQTTNISYVYYSSENTAVGKDYTIRYANGSSGTNVGFNESGLAFYSSDNGDSYTELAGTPDIYINIVKEGDQLQMGGCNWDLLGNEFCSFNFYSDDIGDVNFPISTPGIEAYQNFYNNDMNNHTNENEDLNGTYSNNMTIHINIAIDPDSVGNVTHNLTLHNVDGTYNATINESFLSPTDSDIHIHFDTNDVANGVYRMNVAATAGDNVLDIKSFMQENNFTIDNTNPNIQIIFPVNNSNTTDIQKEVNYTHSNVNEDTCWWDDGTTTTMLASCGTNITGETWNEGLNNITVYINDTANNQNSSFVRFRLDTTPPSFDFVLADQVISESQDLDYDIDATDIGVGVDGYIINSTYSLFTIDFTTGVITNDSSLSGQAGEYYFNVSVNDTLNNKNTSILFVNVTAVDSTPPEFTIVYPTNNTNTSNSNLHINYTATDNNALDECWYSNDTWAVNYSLTDCSTNITTITWSEGVHNVIVFGNDTTGNENQSNIISFNIDTIPPNVQITFPALNNTNTTDYDYNVNFTYSDTNVDTCWWSDDGGSTNTMFGSCDENITSIGGWVEGFNTVSIFINDTSNNINSSNITFRVDTKPPVFDHTLSDQEITENENLQYVINATDLGVGLSGYVINSTYSLFEIEFDTGNITNTSSLSGQTGEYYFNVSVNDTLDNKNTSILFVNVTVPTDITNPNIQILFPVQNNTNTTDTAYDINYTASDETSLDTCWWLVNGGSINILTDCTTNITGNTWAEGLNLVEIYANDTSNNINSSNITFRLDTTPPTIIYDNVTFQEGTSLDFNINATDSGVGVDAYVINWSSQFTINETNGSLTNSSALATGEYWINISVNDTLNNLAEVTMLVNVTAIPDTTLPNINIIYPTNTTYNFSSIDINYTASDETALSYCWYSNDSGGTNSTPQTCSTNWTIIYADGGHNVIVYVNDTSNNQNSSNISFFIDTTPPSFSPALATQTIQENQDLDYNMGATDGSGVGLSGFTINDTYSLFSVNFATGVLTNTSSLVGNDGEYYFNVSINDTQNNKYSEILLVNVTATPTDTTPPTFDNPRNITHTVNTSLSESYTASDGSGISYYWLNDTSVFNVSQSGTLTNVTKISNIFIHYLNISVNDTAGNQRSLVFWINITDTPSLVITGLSASDMILGYNADLIKYEEDGLTFTYRR